MTDWRKASHKPQEFVPVLCFVPGAHNGVIQEEPDEMHIAFLKSGSFHLQDDDHMIIEPTHWMPLPALPEKQ